MAAPNHGVIAKIESGRTDSVKKLLSVFFSNLEKPTGTSYPCRLVSADAADGGDQKIYGALAFEVMPSGNIELAHFFSMMVGIGLIEAAIDAVVEHAKQGGHPFTGLDHYHQQIPKNPPAHTDLQYRNPQPHTPPPFLKSAGLESKLTLNNKKRVPPVSSRSCPVSTSALCGPQRSSPRPPARRYGAGSWAGPVGVNGILLCILYHGFRARFQQCFRGRFQQADQHRVIMRQFINVA